MFQNHAVRLVQRQFTPAILNILPEHIYSHTNPIIVGVRVEGNLNLGSPLCIPSKGFLELGSVTAIRTLNDSTPVTLATPNQVVIVKIEQSERGARNIIYNREFDFTNKLYVRFSNTVPLAHEYRISNDPWIRSYFQTFGLIKKH